MAGRARLVVVGAGPAGLTSAAEASARGMQVTVVDEGAVLGGQFFRARQDSMAEGSPRRLGLGDADAQILLRTTVVDAPTDGVLATWSANRRIEYIEYDWLVLATGAYDRPVPIPGWTLPGVLTAGGAHALAKTNGVVPGKRLLVAGSGPFILAVADVLVARGCSVTTLEATPFTMQIAGLKAVVRDPELLRQAAGYMGRLALHRATPRYGWMVTRIIGNERVESAIVQRVDIEWRPVPGSEKALQVDGVCLGFGFVPRLDLAQLLGCSVAYQADSSDYRLQTNAHMRTTRERIFAAGEVTGVAGVRVAHVEGRLAGLSVAREAGLVTAAEFELRQRDLSARLGKLRRAAEWIRVAFRPRPALWSLAQPPTVVCRCEDVTLEAAERALCANSADPLSVKVATRIGMGLCQGRICSPYLIEWLRAKHGYRPAAAGRPWSVRPPISPVPIGDLASHTDRRR